MSPKKTFVAIDEKTMRGSRQVTGAKGIHIVSAWADELGLVPGQIKTDEKSNEITAILELLKLLDLKELIVMIDASLENIETVKKAIRRHWGIENRLHWYLDISFGEDSKRHRKDHCPENMTVMRRIALSTH